MVWNNSMKQKENAEIPMTDSKDSELVNYDSKVTQLFTCLENSGWDEAKDICKANPTQASIWVYRLERNSKKLRWRMLPLHAAIIFKGNDEVFNALIEAYPEAVKLADDQGMLPLHLAFLKDVNESMINKLISLYPESIQTKDNNGRTPMALLTSKSGCGNNNQNFLRLYFTSLIKERDLAITSIQKTNDELQQQLRQEDASKGRMLELEKLLSKEKAKSSTLSLELEVKTNLAHSLYNEVSDLKVNFFDLKATQSKVEVKIEETLQVPPEERDESVVEQEEKHQNLKQEVQKIADNYKKMMISYENDKESNCQKISHLEESLNVITKENKELVEKNKELEGRLKSRELGRTLDLMFSESKDGNNDTLGHCSKDVSQLRQVKDERREDYDALKLVYAQEKQSLGARVLSLQSKLEESTVSNKRMVEKLAMLEKDSEKKKEHLEKQQSEIGALILERGNNVSEKDALTLKVDELQHKLEASREVQSILKENHKELFSFIEQLISEINGVNNALGSEKQKPQLNVTKIDLKVQAAIVRLKYIKLKCEESRAKIKDYKKLRLDMDELLSANSNLMRHPQTKYSHEVRHLDLNVKTLRNELEIAQNRSSYLEKQLENLGDYNKLKKNLRSVQEENVKLKGKISLLNNTFKENRSEAQKKVQSRIFNKISREDGLKQLIELNLKSQSINEKISTTRARFEKLQCSKSEDFHTKKLKEDVMHELFWLEKARKDHEEAISLLKKRLESISANVEEDYKEEDDLMELSEALVNYEQTIKDLEFLLETEKKYSSSLMLKVKELESH